MAATFTTGDDASQRNLCVGTAAFGIVYLALGLLCYVRNPPYIPLPDTVRLLMPFFLASYACCLVFFAVGMKRRRSWLVLPIFVAQVVAGFATTTTFVQLVWLKTTSRNSNSAEGCLWHIAFITVFTFCGVYMFFKCFLFFRHQKPRLPPPLPPVDYRINVPQSLDRVSNSSFVSIDLLQ